MDDLQPGQVISPRDENDLPVPPPGVPEPERPEVPEPNPAPAPTSTPEPAVTAALPPVSSEPENTQTDAPNWQYHQDPDSVDARTPFPDHLSWTASEFIAHEKNASWYAGLVFAGAGVAVIDYLLTRDVFSTGVILFAAVAFGVFAARKPQTQQYNIDHQGVWIGNKSYSFQDFKTFSIVEEDAATSIVFMPLKRFMPPLTIYTTPEIEAEVVDYLASFLPHEQHKNDAIDSLLRRIRF